VRRTANGDRRRPVAVAVPGCRPAGAGADSGR
jgi:hypothetical protein